MNYAGILAGGKGTRMGWTDRPKQYLKLGDDDKPIIIHTIEAFIPCDDIDQIIVAVPEIWLEYTGALVVENFTRDEAQRVHVIEGGSERSGSLENICAYIEKTWGLHDDDVLVSHDAVRPFVTQRVIKENIEGAHRGGCVNTVVAATDTIVVSEDGQVIDEIPPRSHYYHGQTPQSFPIREYREAFATLTDDQKASLTDACKVYLLSGKPIHMVMGEYSNIKITTPHDIFVATSILNASRPCPEATEGETASL